MPRPLLIGALPLALGLAGPARAGPPPIAWEAPPECPTQAAVEAQVAAMLAGSLRAPAPGTRLQFRVDRDERGRWRLRGALEGPDGPAERTLTARDCAALAEAAALIAAIAVDPQVVAPGEVPVPSDIPADAPASEPPALVPDPPAPAVPVPEVLSPEPSTPAEGPQPASPVDPPDPPARRRRGPGRRLPLAAELGVSAGLGLGALPRPAALLRLHLGLRGPLYRVGARATAWLPREAAAPGHPEVGGRFWLASGGVYACAVLRAGAVVEVPLCGAFDVGALGGRGIGELASAYSARSPWAGLSVGPGLHITVARRIAVQLAAEGLAVLARPRFEITGRGAPCCADTFGGQFTLGLAGRLP